MKSTSPSVSETWMSSTWLSSRMSSSWDSWNSYTTSTEVTETADTMSVFCQEHGGRGRLHPHILFFRSKDEALPYQPHRQTVGYNSHHLKEKSGRTAELLRHPNCWQEHTTTDPKQLHAQNSYCINKKKSQKSKRECFKKNNILFRFRVLKSGKISNSPSGREGHGI